MKYLPLLCLALCSCTSIDTKKGTFFNIGDSKTFKMNANATGITHVEWSENSHSAVVTAAANGTGNVVVKTGMAIMGAKAPGVIQSVVK